MSPDFDDNLSKGVLSEALKHCPQCKGGGIVQDVRGNIHQCDRCLGSGLGVTEKSPEYQHDYDNTLECPECHGTGQDENRWAECGRCGGTGEVEVDWTPP